MDEPPTDAEKDIQGARDSCCEAARNASFREALY